MHTHGALEPIANEAPGACAPVVHAVGRVGTLHPVTHNGSVCGHMVMVCELWRVRAIPVVAAVAAPGRKAYRECSSRPCHQNASWLCRTRTAGVRRHSACWVWRTLHCTLQLAGQVFGHHSALPDGPRHTNIAARGPVRGEARPALARLAGHIAERVVRTCPPASCAWSGDGKGTFHAFHWLTSLKR